MRSVDMKWQTTLANYADGTANEPSPKVVLNT